ncbi:MAG: hypothetical protein MZV70_20585 [Desulfobacterales bacterium]|nr:hypothetical protein [Desulfobacterales bacterium]
MKASGTPTCGPSSSASSRWGWSAPTASSGMLEQTAHMLENEVVPRLQRFLVRLAPADAVAGRGRVRRCCWRCFWLLTLYGGYWDGLSLRLPFWAYLADYPDDPGRAARRCWPPAAGYVPLQPSGAGPAARVARRLARRPARCNEFLPNYMRAFRKNSRWFRSIFRRHPAGWGRGARPQPGQGVGGLAEVRPEAERHVRQPVGRSERVAGRHRSPPLGSPLESPPHGQGPRSLIKMFVSPGFIFCFSHII